MTTSTSPANGPPIPEMREAMLSRDEVLALVRDLRAHTRLQGTRCKSGPRSQTSANDTPLEVAIEHLLNRTVPAIQIRYAYEDHEWTDTLLNSPAGIRLVRCRHERAN